MVLFPMFDMFVSLDVLEVDRFHRQKHEVISYIYIYYNLYIFVYIGRYLFFFWGGDCFFNFNKKCWEKAFC